MIGTMTLITIPHAWMDSPRGSLHSLPHYEGTLPDPRVPPACLWGRRRRGRPADPRSRPAYPRRGLVLWRACPSPARGHRPWLLTLGACPPRDGRAEVRSGPGSALGGRRHG